MQYFHGKLLVLDIVSFCCYFLIILERRHIQSIPSRCAHNTFSAFFHFWARISTETALMKSSSFRHWFERHWFVFLERKSRILSGANFLLKMITRSVSSIGFSAGFIRKETFRRQASNRKKNVSAIQVFGTGNGYSFVQSLAILD